MSDESREPVEEHIATVLRSLCAHVPEPEFQTLVRAVAASPAMRAYVRCSPPLGTRVSLPPELADDKRTSDRYVQRDATPSRRPPRVLLIDDDPDVRRACERLFRRAGYEVETVGEATAGVERARAWKPDLVLLDLRIPGAHGTQIASELKLHPATRETIVVAFSGWLAGHDDEELQAAGFDAALSKSDGTHAMLGRVDELLRARA